VVIPIPDSSRPAAMQLSKYLDLPYREGFIKNRYIGRTFIMPGQATRKKSVRQKLNAIGMEFRGKSVMLVDDSIVRGTTSREIVQMAREAGARKVYFASAAPPVRFPNVYGIDMPTRDELIANGRTDAEIAREIGCDELIYQDLVFQRRLHHRRRDAGISRWRRSAAPGRHPCRAGCRGDAARSGPRTGGLKHCPSAPGLTALGTEGNLESRRFENQLAGA
jgi:amidophosphoribosyltransferase